MPIHNTNGAPGDRSQLNIGEHHPASQIAAEYLRSIPGDEMGVIMEALSSCAIEGNRMAEVCSGTLRMFLRGELVGERYLMGLAIFISRSRRDFSPQSLSCWGDAEKEAGNG